jgi:IS5 family transposase
VEHPFRVIKRQFGFQKTRYRGIKKNDHKLKMLFALARETLIKTHPSLQGGLILIHETATRDDSASLPL